MTNNKPPSCDLLPEFYGTKLKPCPFCGTYPETSSPIFSRDRLRIVNSVRHPNTGKCPLDILIFREGEWSHRNSIPRRYEVMELLRLVDIIQNEPIGGYADYSKNWGELKQYADKLRKELGE